jgi:hypothetical protein
MVCVFLALGTAGDVLPVLSIALHCSKDQSFPASCILFATHESHRPVFERLCAKNTGDRHTAVAFHGIASPSFVPLPSANHLTISTEQRLKILDAQRKGCLEACRGARIILFNLFAMEGFSIAELMRVPSIAISPYTMPHLHSNANDFGEKENSYTSFLHAFQKEHSQMWSAIQRMQGPVVDGVKALELSDAERQRVVFLEEFEQWMWPLFCEDWGEWRQSLGLHSLPLMTMPAPLSSVLPVPI